MSQHLLILISFIAATNAVKLTYEKLTTIGATFAGRLGRSDSQAYYVQPGSFQFITSCNDFNSNQCMGSSKISPLGVAMVPFSHEEKKLNIVHRDESCEKSFLCQSNNNNDHSAAFHLHKDEAIVLFGITPPEHVEYSFNTMLYSRNVQHFAGPSTTATADAHNGRKCIKTKNKEDRCLLLAPISSVSSSYNNNHGRKHIKVEKEHWRTTFDQPVAIIISSNMNVTRSMKEHLIDAGMPINSINELPLLGIPSSDIHMSLKQESDKFTIRLKMNLPNNNLKEISKYIETNPFQLFRFTPVPNKDDLTKANADGTLMTKTYKYFDWSDAPRDDDSTTTTHFNVISEKMETFYDTSYKAVNLNIMLNVLENEIISQLQKSNIITKLGRAMRKNNIYNGKECIINNMKCFGKPYWNENSVVVSYIEELVILGGNTGKHSANSIVIYGILHSKTNLTNYRK